MGSPGRELADMIAYVSAQLRLHKRNEPGCYTEVCCVNTMYSFMAPQPSHKCQCATRLTAQQRTQQCSRRQMSTYGCNVRARTPIKADIYEIDTLVAQASCPSVAHATACDASSDGVKEPAQPNIRVS